MRLIGVVIALVLAFGAFYAALNFLGGSSEPGGPAPGQSGVVVQTSEPDVQTVDVLVASRPIPIGEKIKADMVDAQPWPKHLVVPGFVTTGDKTQNIIDMVTRGTFQKGEPILLSKLANPSDPSFLAAALPPGKKMVTLSTDGIAGLAGFVFPGDRVDVIVTHPIPREDADPENLDDKDSQETVTETVLHNVKVLAVDQRAEAGTTEEKIPLPSSISLEVSLEDAQRLRLAQETGYLSMALRSLEDKDAVDEAGVTHVQNLTKSDAYSKLGKSKDEIIIVRGTEAATIKVEKTTAPEAEATDSPASEIEN